MYVSSAISHIRQNKTLEDVSKDAGTRTTSIDSIPGILLQTSLVNLFSDELEVRQSAYVLLPQLQDSYHISLSHPLFYSDTIILPTNPLAFATSISSGILYDDLLYIFIFINSLNLEICRSSPEFAEEFISECFEVFFQKLYLL